MNAMQKMLLIPSSALLLAAGVGSAQADSLPVDRLDDVLNHASSYGFTHYEEIGIKSRGRAEVEGWIDDEWFAEVEISLDNGEALKEQRERRISGAWGMTDDDVRQAMDVARQEGLAEFEDIEIDQRGMIDIDGRDANGRELEISVRQGADSASGIDRD